MSYPFWEQYVARSGGSKFRNILCHLSKAKTPINISLYNIWHFGQTELTYDEADAQIGPSYPGDSRFRGLKIFHKFDQKYSYRTDARSRLHVDQKAEDQDVDLIWMAFACRFRAAGLFCPLIIAFSILRYPRHGNYSTFRYL